MSVVRRRGTRRVVLRSGGMRLVSGGEGAVGGSAKRAAVGGRWVSCGLLGGGEGRERREVAYGFLQSIPRCLRCCRRARLTRSGRSTSGS